MELYIQHNHDMSVLSLQSFRNHQTQAYCSLYLGKVTDWETCSFNVNPSVRQLNPPAAVPIITPLLISGEL